MTVPSNDDFASRELSIEELETIAGGGLWGWIKHEASDALHWVENNGARVAVEIGKAIVAIGGPIYNGHPPHKMS